MKTAPIISPAVFASVFARFKKSVQTRDESHRPFTTFQCGLAYDWEHYKEWVFYEAQRRLGASSWKSSWIGNGKILDRVIAAIEIREGNDYFNNIVDWDGRRGEKANSHRKLVIARKTQALRKPAEDALFRMYSARTAPAHCFAELVKQFGPRYDLISYLFFIRDWQKFMPVRPTYFSLAFEELGIPHEMSGLCEWDNYVGYMSRLREVQRRLTSYDIPDGVRLIDAHTFCWLLARLPSPKKAGTVPIQTIEPIAGPPPARSEGKGEGNEIDFEAKYREQKRIGILAESIVLKAEQARLKKAGRPDLAEKVQDVSENVALGYDIASFTVTGEPKPIEVKAAARLQKSLRFFLTENERLRSLDIKNYTFALVLGVESDKPMIREFLGSKLPAGALHPSVYEVRLSGASS